MAATNVDPVVLTGLAPAIPTRSVAPRSNKMCGSGAVAKTIAARRAAARYGTEAGKGMERMRGIEPPS